MTVTTPETAPAVTAGRKRRLPLWLAAVVVVLLIVAGFVVWQHRGPGTAPYQDKDASGRLTLCDGGSKAVTEGSVRDRPFAARVVGSRRVPAAQAPGATATLYAYQPRKGAEPSEWTGIPLTAPTPVDATASTSATVGSDATTLAQFLGGYPASWDGWLQVRLLVTSPADGAVGSYDSVDLKVSGDHWQAVDAGTATCPS